VIVWVLEIESFRLFAFAFRNRAVIHRLVVFFFFAFRMLTMLASPTPFGFNQTFMLPQDLAVLLIVNFIFSSHKNSFLISSKNIFAG
jgi:glucose uptake protein GlcU